MPTIRALTQIPEDLAPAERGRVDVPAVGPEHDVPSSAGSQAAPSASDSEPAARVEAPRRRPSGKTNRELKARNGGHRAGNGAP
jgi:hypothetical protein